MNITEPTTKQDRIGAVKIFYGMSEKQRAHLIGLYIDWLNADEIGAQGVKDDDERDADAILTFLTVDNKRAYNPLRVLVFNKAYKQYKNN